MASMILGEHPHLADWLLGRKSSCNDTEVTGNDANGGKWGPQSMALGWAAQKGNGMWKIWFWNIIFTIIIMNNSTKRSGDVLLKTLLMIIQHYSHNGLAITFTLSNVEQDLRFIEAISMMIFSSNYLVSPQRETHSAIIVVTNGPANNGINHSHAQLCSLFMLTAK